MIRSLTEINLDKLSKKKFTPSPLEWEDQVLYFLLLDRFSNNTEKGYVPGGTIPLFTSADNGNAVRNEVDAKAWRDAGGTWCGGNIKGLSNKIPYLKQLGVTTLWISPVFKQVERDRSYHGYGIQNYLEVDHHYGTKEALKAFVKKAHDAGLYVILDIILNHAGNIFTYQDDNNNIIYDPPYTGKKYKVKGFNNATGQPSLPFATNIAAGDEDAIWPVEFQDPDCFTQKGMINNWDYQEEYCAGDFFSLKDMNLGHGPIDNYQPAKALLYLSKAYKYWIVYLDIDGYRVDTVKHMDDGAARFFASEIHEFVQSIGKENFYLVGEITGGREYAFNKLEATGLDAALGIDDVQPKMEQAAKGHAKPQEYFNLFRNSILVGKESHTWFKNKIVTMVDDHDKVVEGDHKTRFCANEAGNTLVINVLALNLTTLGIPCIYYGTEQGFDGEGIGGGCDKYIRETMFGSEFGAFRSKGKHFFDKNNVIYKLLSEIIAIRKEKIALRRGRQYLREISDDGVHFGLPDFIGQSKEIRSVIAWSRILDNDEMILAINTDTISPRSAWVTIDNTLHAVGNIYSIIYSTDKSYIGNKSVIGAGNGKSLMIEAPKAGFVIYEKVM